MDDLKPARKTPPLPLEDDWFLSPVEIASTEATPKPVQAQQGDIFLRVPSLVVETRPFSYLRPASFSPPPKLQEWLSNAERKGPTRLIDIRVEAVDLAEKISAKNSPWETTGEMVVSHGHRTMAILMTNSCELDKPRNKVLLTFARVRLAEGASAGAVEIMRRRNKYRAFYLAPQDGPPLIPECYVDFGALTTVRLDSLPMEEDDEHFRDRFASLTPAVRDAMLEDFIDYVTAVREEE